MWIEILSKYFEETVEIRKDQPLGFLVIEPKHLKFKYETSKKEKKKKKFKPKDYVINIKDYDINNIATDRINQIIPLPKEPLRTSIRRHLDYSVILENGNLIK